jgi:hypothetical protein
MERFIGRGVLLAGALGVAFSCSSPARDFGGAGAGTSGVDARGDGPDASAGTSTGAAAGTHAGSPGTASSNGGGAEGGEGGISGPGAGEAAGAAGAAGAGDCHPAETRSCSNDGALGPCAAGTETCTTAATWEACSVKPAASDTCVAGNNDNCTGAANEGCQCINGVTKKTCGACNDGTQVCADGKTNTYGACSGAVLQPTTYYRDADGDGFGSAATTTVCGPPPAGYTDQTGDCCDDGGNLAVAKTIFPGQTQFFSASTTVCNIGWNYDCSTGGSIETSAPNHVTSCITGTASCTNVFTSFTTADCGTTFCGGGCAMFGPGQPCTLNCVASPTVMCH